MKMYLLDEDGNKQKLAGISYEMFEEIIFNGKDSRYEMYNSGTSDTKYESFLSDRSMIDIGSFTFEYLKKCSLIIEGTYSQLIIPLSHFQVQKK